MSRRLLLYVFLTGMLIQPLRGICQNHAPVSRKELLQQYMDDLKSRPDDFALREQIIKLVATMPDKPKVTQNEYVLFGQAKAALTGATGSKDLSGAIKAFKQLSVDAPWLANVYFDLAKVEEDNEQYKDAIANLKLYLLADPQAANPEAIAERIGADQEAAKRPAQPVASSVAPETTSPAAQTPSEPAQSTAAVPEEQNAVSAGWTLSSVSAEAGGCDIFMDCTNASLDVAISSGGGNATSVDYSVEDPAPMRMAREWSTGDTIRAGVPDVNHHCPSDVDDSILTDQARDQWICAEYMEGGSGTISRIVSEDPSCSDGAGIYLTDMDPPNAGAEYCLSGKASRTVQESWQVGDRISVGDSSCGVLGQLLRNERTDQQICTQ